MNFSDMRNSMQLLWARLKIEGSFLPTFPRFRATLTLLLVLGLIGVTYGHLWDRSTQNEGLSLTLSAIAFGGSFVISMLSSPVKRFKTFLSQIISLILLILLGIAIGVCYQMFYGAVLFPESIQYAWLIGTLLLGFITSRVLASAFGRFIVSSEGRYPGLISSPLLFALLVINYVWWMWPSIMAWLQTL